MPDLVCIGLTTLDIPLRPVELVPAHGQTTLVDEIALAPAGTAGGTAVIAAKLGLDAALISAVGDDVNGRVTTLLLSEAKVGTEHVATCEGMRSSTTVLAIRPDGERPNFHMMGASVMTQLTPDAMAAAMAAKVFHFAGVGFPNLSGPEVKEALATFRAAGVTVTCDLIAPPPELAELLPILLPQVDVFMPSRAEVDVLLGEISNEDALRRFVALGAKHCFIKLGSDGVIGLIDGSVCHFPAQAITPVDTTSCGDAFCAGVIYGLAKEMAMQDAASCGVATASFVAQGLGTVGALSGSEEVLALMAAS